MALKGAQGAVFQRFLFPSPWGGFLYHIPWRRVPALSHIVYSNFVHQTPQGRTKVSAGTAAFMHPLPFIPPLSPPPPLFNVGTLLRPLPTRILLNPTLSGGRGGGGAAGGYFCPALHRGSQKWRIRSLVYRPLIRSVLCGFSCMER